MSDIYKKLLAIQEVLKAPKDKNNDFGKYRYRSFEQICEAIKEPLKAVNATVFVRDELELIGNRFYVKAVASFVDCETGEHIEATAYAREEETKKGMDGSQITGTSSSYARKYAMNGLFLIDDTKDADTNAFSKACQLAEDEEKEQAKKIAEENNKPASKAMKDSIKKLAEEKGKPLADEAIEKMTVGQYTAWMKKLKEME